MSSSASLEEASFDEAFGLRITRAIAAWTGQLVDVSGRNTLLCYRDLKAGTLDLSHADEIAIERLLAGHTVRLSNALVGPVWDPATLFSSSADWLDGWPDLVPMVAGLILVPDDDGSIGAGCLREVADVLGRDRQVWLYDDNHLIPWDQVAMKTVSQPSRFRVATVSVISQSGGRTRPTKETTR